MVNTEDLKPFLREGEVAELLNLSKSHLQRRRWKKLPPQYVKFGRTVRYRREDIIAYAENAPVIGGDHV